uniref:Nuclease HARBI1 n=1 Tax=Cacopsylla melanoneura TaxID=428564 RepID=A0A8D8Z3U1_9HEMI
MNAELYRNRKGWFSINVHVVCNARLEIMEVISRWPGSVHDSTIFQNSEVRIDFEQRRRYPGCFLLGDRGYACNSYLLTPLTNPQTPAERKYNKSHIKTRNTVERCFGVWKSRFPCLQYVLRNKVERSVVVITAAAVLHNIAVQRNLPEFEIGEVPQNEIIIEGPHNGRDITAVRAALIDTVFR